MKLLYLTHKCPYPPNKGERIRCFNILKHLSKQYEVHLVYPIFSHEDVGQADNFKEYAKSITTSHINTYLAKIKCIYGFFSRSPFTLHYFYSRNLKEIIKNQEFDIVIADCSSMAQYVIDVEKPKIVDFVDIDSDKWQLYARNSRLSMSIIYNIEYRRLKIFEKTINAQFDFCLVVSEDEKKLLQYGENVVVVPNGIDLEFFTPRGKQNSNTLIFTGAMNYFPNIDGVSYFHRDIWPLVKAHIPNVKFVVAGMYPPPKLRALASDDTTITGYVPDVRDYLAQATVCVVPLRMAKGIQNKILEAMAMGIPVVATTAANTGINARDKHQILVADSPDDFAKAVVTLLKDTQLRQTIADNARQFVQENFSWDKNLSKLDELIAQLTKN